MKPNLIAGLTAGNIYGTTAPIGRLTIRLCLLAYFSMTLSGAERFNQERGTAHPQKHAETVPILERTVKAGKHVHDVAPHTAKPGERPNDYGSPGREHHGKGPPPGKGHEKKP